MKTLIRNAGFSLVEVTIALGVASFCLVAVFGLLPLALSSNQTAIEQTTADGILSSVISDLRATPPTVPVGGAADSRQFAINIPAAGGGGMAAQTIYFNGEQQLVAQGDARYRLTITFLPTPVGGGVRAASCAILQISWPAGVDPSAGKAKPAGSVSTFVALDRN